MSNATELLLLRRFFMGTYWLRAIWAGAIQNHQTKELRTNKSSGAVDINIVLIFPSSVCGQNRHIIVIAVVAVIAAEQTNGRA